MRVVLLGLAGALALGGCMAGSLTDAQATCTASPSYLQSWSCIRAKVAAGQAGQMRNDEGLHYLAVGDALAERVRARQITDADAKLALAGELRGANANFNARRDATADSLIAAGAVLSAPSQPSLAPPISCTSRVFAGTVRTDC
jgi:hypothetical protein